MSHQENIDEKLARLAGATARVQPRADFSSRVMQRIGQEQLGTLYALRTPARRFLPLGMLAAAAAMFWAVSVDSQVTEALASSDDMELVW
ncbi:MAG: hypothetical protein EOO73_01460 [Myxococcales bacterium]|nr:MAG: hypothetical protein EOO73_01460 [Myxococcales bacterium]